MRLACPAIAVTVLVLASSIATAQIGGISVTVEDVEGMPLPGATVTVSHEAGYVRTTADLTDRRGVVEFPVLRAGSGYAVQVTFPGMAGLRHTDLTVTIDGDLELSVRMTGPLDEQVRVNASREIVDLEVHETATRFTDEFIRDLPVPGRFYQNILTMAPGVQDADGDGNPNVHGSRSRDFQAIVSGVSNVDPLTGHWMSRVNPNSIEALEIVTAGAGVEFGGAQGGFARIVQKQGSNDHEGVFELYWQTSRLDKEGAVDTTSTELPEFETVQTLVHASGPLVRDRLWYRVSLEQRNTEDPVNTVKDIGIYRQDTENHDVQLTWQVSPRNKLAFQFRADPSEESNFGISSSVSAEASQRRTKDAPTYSLNWMAAQSPRMLVETTVAWQDAEFFKGPTRDDVTNDCTPYTYQAFLRESYCLDRTVNQASGPYFRTEDDRRQRFTVRTQGTIHAGRFLGAVHRLKLGINVENERYFRDLTRRPSINYTEYMTTGLTAQLYGSASTTISVPETADAKATATRWALYAENQMKPTHNLTTTVGLRIDREELKSPGHEQFDPSAQLQGYLDKVLIGHQPHKVWPEFFTGYEGLEEFKAELAGVICRAFSPAYIGQCITNVRESVYSQAHGELHHLRRDDELRIANTNVSPYLALAWAPWSDGKTAFKFTVGRHYNRNFLVIPLQEVEPPLTDVLYQVNIDTLNANLAGIESTLNMTTVDRGLKTPYADELTFSFERELWPETALRVTRIERKYRDQIQDTNVNRAAGDFGACVRMEYPQDDFIAESPGGGPGSGLMIRDVLTGKLYEDTDPGPGDGRLDDCVGDAERVAAGPLLQGWGVEFVSLHRPDGLPEQYIQNPFWGDIMRVGNFNRIDYEAWVLELTRRQYRNWEMQTSYTWSKAIGDGEDFFQELGNDPTRAAATYGYQSYDQRHVVKINAATVTPWGIRLGTAVSWQSGLPYSVTLLEASPDPIPLPVDLGNGGSRARRNYPTGRRNDQRNPGYWNVDVKVTRELKFGNRFDLQLSAEIFNLLDDATFMIYNPFFERGERLAGTNEGRRRFGRRWQVGVRVAF